MTAEIRRATYQDIEEMIQLLHSLFSVEADFSANPAKQRLGLELMLEKPEERCIMVATIDKSVIGMCTVQMVITTAEGGYAALIEDMVVREDYRYQGIGKRLLQTIEEWAWNRGVKRLELLADQNNHSALAFYNHLKWQKTQLICLHKKT